MSPPEVETVAILLARVRERADLAKTEARNGRNAMALFDLAEAVKSLAAAVEMVAGDMPARHPPTDPYSTLLGQKPQR